MVVLQVFNAITRLQRGRKMGQRSERSERRNGADATFGYTAFAPIKSSEKKYFQNVAITTYKSGNM
jgi:hypothetical protein